MKSLSRVWLLATPRTAPYQAPVSMGFSRQEYWSGLPLPSPNGILLSHKKTNVIYSKMDGPRDSHTEWSKLDSYRQISHDIAYIGLPWWLSRGRTGHPGLIPGSGRFPGGGHGNPLQYPCLENPMVRGAWWATVHGVTKSWTQLKQLSTQAHIAYIRNWKKG